MLQQPQHILGIVQKGVLAGGRRGCRCRISERMLTLDKAAASPSMPTAARHVVGVGRAQHRPTRDRSLGGLWGAAEGPLKGGLRCCHFIILPLPCRAQKATPVAHPHRCRRRRRRYHPASRLQPPARCGLIAPITLSSRGARSQRQ